MPSGTGSNAARRVYLLRFLTCQPFKPEKVFIKKPDKGITLIKNLYAVRIIKD